MTTFETVFIVLAGIILLPSFCQLIHRPTLLFCSYLMLGVALGGFILPSTRFMLEEVGTIGFLLLLFLIGLEIEIPLFTVLKKSIPFCASWMLVQIPLFAVASWFFDLGWGYGVVAGAGVNACSLGIAYGLLKSQERDIESNSQKQILIEMALLEVISLVILVGSDAVYANGWGKEVVIQAVILLLFILSIRIFSGLIHKYLGRLIEGSGKWRLHQFFLILLLVTMIGYRLGLSAPKTAFFLGLFMSAVTHNGLKIEDELKPIAQRILIPVFFIGLGTKISLDNLFPHILPSAILITCLLICIRFWIFRYTTSYSISSKYFLLFCPNITMVAVSADILSHAHATKDQIDLLLVTGLFMTLGAAISLPTPNESKSSLDESSPKLELTNGFSECR